MKKILFNFIAFFIVSQAVAQPTGQSYTLQSLSQYAPNAVQCTQPNQYRILENLTLLASDTLVLESSVVSVTVDNGVTLTFNGKLLIEDRNQVLLIQGDSTQNNYFEMRFEDAPQSILFDVHVQYCNHITLINSDIQFDFCEFDHFSGHVISFMNCNPVIQNCYFHDNQACAVQSAVNTDGCPKILNNTFYNNVLANANTPQINLGSGTTDTIKIVGNLIRGVASNMSGGIGIMNISNPNVTKVLLKDNMISNNRYGYTQNGCNISAEIYNNDFWYNNLEVNPNNGGSGISIYGSDTTCAAKLRHNHITGNLWGVTAIYYHHVDMGTAEDPGYNLLYNNGNNGVEYELYNNANSHLDAVGNYWGCDNAEAAEAVIFHQVDNPSYGLVNYQPIYVLEPKISAFSILTENNPQIPVSPMEFVGIFSENGDSIFVDMSGFGAFGDNLLPTIVTPVGVTVTPSVTEFQNFFSPVVYTASTPHLSTRDYVVVVNFVCSLPENELTKINLTPNPVTQGFFTLENPTEEVLSWQIFTSAGQCVMNGKAQPGMNHIATKTLKSGLYLVYIQKDNVFVTKKLIVQ